MRPSHSPRRSLLPPVVFTSLPPGGRGFTLSQPIRYWHLQHVRAFRGRPRVLSTKYQSTTRVPSTSTKYPGIPTRGGSRASLLCQLGFVQFESDFPSAGFCCISHISQGLHVLRGCLGVFQSCFQLAALLSLLGHGSSWTWMNGSTGISGSKIPVRAEPVSRCSSQCP